MAGNPQEKVVVDAGRRPGWRPVSQPGGKPNVRPPRGGDRWFGWQMVAPALCALLVVGAYPYAVNLIYSFRNWNIMALTAPDWVGFANYLKAFGDRLFLASLLRTFGFVGMTLPLEFLLGLCMALLLHREFKGKGLFRALVLLPMMLSPVVTSVVWKMMYSVQFGPLNYLLKVLHVTDGRTEWLSNAALAFPALGVATVWMWFPFSFLVLTASLQGIPEEEYEAARIDGASSWGVFRFITLPHLVPASMVILLVRFIDGLKTFALVYTLTSGGPGSATELVFYHIYKVAFRSFDVGYSSAPSLILVVFSILSCGLILKLGRRYGSYEY